MSTLDDLFDNYDALIEAVRRLEQSRGHHGGEHEFCCEKGRCLKCEEARIEAEDNLHQALLKVEPKPFHLRTNLRFSPQRELPSGSVSVPEKRMKKLGSVAGEYLRTFFTEFERLKNRTSCDVSHAISFWDERLTKTVNVGPHGATRRETRAREAPRQDGGAESSNLSAAQPNCGTGTATDCR